MSEEVLVHTLANIGVPTAVCFYVLLTLNKSINRLNDNFNEFSKYLNDLHKPIEKRLERLEEVVFQRN